MRKFALFILLLSAPAVLLARRGPAPEVDPLTWGEHTIRVDTRDPQNMGIVYVDNPDDPESSFQIRVYRVRFAPFLEPIVHFIP